jgi:biotin carboxyl carrier protein
VDEQVVLGQRLLVLEAMKMQQDIVAPVTGRVRSIEVRPGQQIATGDSLLYLEPGGSPTGD